MPQYFFNFLLMMSMLPFHGHNRPAGDGYFSNSQFVEINDLTMHYRIWNTDLTASKGKILLVHGFGGSTFSWEQVAPMLSNHGYEVVALDVPPFGFSEKANNINGSVSARAHLVHEFVMRLDPDSKWHLAGHSMGGGIVLAMALLFPDQYLTLHLTGPALFKTIVPGKPNMPVLLKIPGVASFAGNIAQEWMITYSQIESMLESAYGQKPSQEQVQQYYKPLGMEGTSRAILNNARKATETDTLRIKDLRVPALVTWGEEDTWVPYEENKETLELIPSMELEILPNSGHNPMETHPVIYLNKYLDYLKRWEKKQE